MSSALAGYKQQINQQIEHQFASKVRQERTKTSIELEKERGLKFDLTAERHRTQTKNFKAQTEGVRASQAQVGYQTELVKLSTAQVNLNTERVLYGKAVDRLGYEQADRALTQMQQRATLTLKAIDVQSLREDVRHKTLIDGGAAPYFVPKAGNAYAIPSAVRVS